MTPDDGAPPLNILTTPDQKPENETGARGGADSAPRFFVNVFVSGLRGVFRLVHKIVLQLVKAILGLSHGILDFLGQGSNGFSC